VRDALEGNFAEHDEVGAALCIRVGDRAVVDLVGGWADQPQRLPFGPDTLVNAYSVGKGVLAVLCQVLLERHEISLDRPICDVWPEFAAHDKQATTLRMLLAHRAGLPSVRESLPDDAMYDWHRMTGALAAQAPYWTPGAAHGYHVNTFGFLVGEVLRRETGRGVPDLLREHLTGPLGADFHFGVPAHQHRRVARMEVPVTRITPDLWPKVFPPTGDQTHDRMIWHAYFNPPGLSGIGVLHTPEWRASVIPSTSGHATATAVATIYQAALDGAAGRRRFGSPGTWTEAVRIQSDGIDRVLGRESRFGLGFQLGRPGRPLGRSARSFGHFGYGGSLGFADPDAEVALGFLTTRPGDRWRMPRTERLLEALYGCL
jgi:CubicO group peptidase (beta-lactamase class C family)